jgi:hypothetical protein
MDIASFLYGMYYAGKLPSRAEIGEISKYLCTEGFVKVAQQEVEKQVREAMATMHQAIHPEQNKPIAEQIAEGIKLLDKELGPDWPHKIDLDKLDMRYGHDGVIGQLYGHLTYRFEPGAGVSYGFETSLLDDSGKDGQLTQEWKKKIAQLKQERALT